MMAIERLILLKIIISTTLHTNNTLYSVVAQSHEECVEMEAKTQCMQVGTCNAYNCMALVCCIIMKNYKESPSYYEEASFVSTHHQFPLLPYPALLDIS